MSSQDYHEHEAYDQCRDVNEQDGLSWDQFFSDWSIRQVQDYYKTDHEEQSQQIHSHKTQHFPSVILPAKSKLLTADLSLHIAVIIVLGSAKLALHFSMSQQQSLNPHLEALLVCELDGSCALTGFYHLAGLHALKTDPALSSDGLALTLLLFLGSVDDQELGRIFGLVIKGGNDDGEGRSVGGRAVFRLFHFNLDYNRNLEYQITMITN